MHSSVDGSWQRPQCNGSDATGVNETPNPPISKTSLPIRHFCHCLILTRSWTSPNRSTAVPTFKAHSPVRPQRPGSSSASHRRSRNRTA